MWMMSAGRLGAELNELVADGNLVKALSAARAPATSIAPQSTGGIAAACPHTIDQPHNVLAARSIESVRRHYDHYSSVIDTRVSVLAPFQALLFGTLAFFGNLFVQTLIQQIGESACSSSCSLARQSI